MPRIRARTSAYVPIGNLTTNRQRKRFKVGRPHKKQPTSVRLSLLPENEDERVYLPTLVFRRRYPICTWVVPALKTPLYWFDEMMLNKKKLITGVPPDTFIVDGRRFKVLVQDHHVIGVGYTRWLVYEEKAVPKGQKP